MITPMKRVLLFCMAAERDRALDHLQSLGVLHLSPVQPPAGENIEQARLALTHARQAVELLTAELPPRHKPGTAAVEPTGGPAALVARVHQLADERETVTEAYDALEIEIQRVTPVGDFDPAHLQELAKAGVCVRLFHEQVEKPLDLPAGVTRVVLATAGRTRHVALIGREPFTVTGEELAAPSQALSVLRQRLTDLEARRTQLSAALAAEALALPALDHWIHTLEDRAVFAQARQGMGSHAAVAYLQGYCPFDAVPQVEAAAREHGWGLAVSTPAPDDSQVPTLVRNPAWIRPIQTVFNVIGIEPGYREVDISAAFLIFFSLFFAILIGDAGYGVLFLLGTWYARRRLPRAPAQPFRLMTLLSVGTVIWGLLTGNIFAMRVLPPLVGHLRIDWLLSESHMIKFCFVLGAVHLTLAHVWNALRMLNSPQALAQLGWILVTWSMYLLSCFMILGEALPGFFGVMLGVGIAAVALFMTPPRLFKQEWYGHVMLPLDVISNFVDLVSYLRLFAVGTASLAVAQNFNEMALGRGIDGVAAGLIAALILVFGHLLNIILGAMGVLVHGVRLNTLEFSRHIGMQWAGIRFAPFARRHPLSKEHGQRVDATTQQRRVV